MTTHIDVTELLRYLTGESTEDEARRMQAWCRLSPANTALLEALRFGGDEGVARLDVDVARGMERLRNRLDGMSVSGVEERVGKTKEMVGVMARRDGVFKAQPLRHNVWPVAVALSAMIMVVTWVASGPSLSRGGVASSLAYATGNGQRATVTLPDGGTVVLNVASRLEIPTDYTAGHHTVRLVGEGLFTVPHYDRAPFTVATGTTITKVLGTRFVIRHYTTDARTIVAVEEGKVAVGDTVVTANQMIEFGRDWISHIGPADASLFSFATGGLTFGNMPLRSAIFDLDRWYDVDIRLADSALATQPFRGEFAAGSVADLEAILEWMYKVRVVRDGRVLTLYSR